MGDGRQGIGISAAVEICGMRWIKQAFSLEENFDLSLEPWSNLNNQCGAFSEILTAFRIKFFVLQVNLIDCLSRSALCDKMYKWNMSKMLVIYSD